MFAPIMPPSLPPIMAVLYANERLHLHQPEDFYWATTRSAPPLAWVKMAARSSRICQGLWRQSLVPAVCWNSAFKSQSCASAANCGCPVASSWFLWRVQSSWYWHEGRLAGCVADKVASKQPGSQEGSNSCWWGSEITPSPHISAYLKET
jgi:hypothetical protein